MIRYFYWGLLCLLLAGTTPADARSRLAGDELVALLQQGGYGIYFRHAATDWSQDDGVFQPGDWRSCDPLRMRQLSPRGREVAREIGRAMQGLQIPVGGVYSSEYCRTRETAELMAIGPVEPTISLMNLRAADFVGGRDAVVARAKALLSMKPPSGENHVFVAHGNLMREALGVYTGEAGAVIFVPQGKDGFEIVAVVEPEDWKKLPN